MDGNQVIEHVETRVNGTIEPNQVHSRCSCGATWSHPKFRTDEAMDSIFEAHKAYFNDKALVL
jgi:hypothetical protein